MEFPHLGHHCFEQTCKQLDFLPVKCDGCSNLFCVEHMSYSSHSCPGAYKKDIQVPVCPLCSTPIPIKRGDPPDIAVGRHIDSNCQSDTAKDHRKVFANRCSSKGCKVKELMPITCSQCTQNFCLRHRHPTDHQCTGSDNKALNAALARQQKSNGPKDWFGPFRAAGAAASAAPANSSRSGPQGRTNFASVQGSIDEDEALARALAASLQDSQPRQPPAAASLTAEQKAQEDEDFQLAKALQQSEQEMRARGGRASASTSASSTSPGKCEVS